MSSRDPPSCPCKLLPQCLSSFTAAEYGNLDALVRLGPSVADKRDVGGYSPLHLAAQNGHVAATCLLLKLGVHVDGKAPPNNTKFVCGATPLHRAAYAGAVSTMKILLDWNKGERCDVLARDTSFGDNMTPLHKAVAGGRYLAVQLILDSVRARDKEDPIPENELSLLSRVFNAKDSQGLTPLLTANSFFRTQVERRQEVRRWDAVAGGSADWGKCIELLLVVERELNGERENRPGVRENETKHKRSLDAAGPIPSHLISGSAGACLDCNSDKGGSQCLTASWEAAFQSVLLASVDSTIANRNSYADEEETDKAMMEDLNDADQIAVAALSRVCDNEIDVDSTVGQHCSSCGSLCFALCISSSGNLVCRTCSSQSKRRKNAWH